MESDMNVLQLQNQLQCIHEYCLARSQDPCVDYAMVKFFSSVSAGHFVKIEDCNRKVLVTFGVSTTLHDDDWIPWVTQVLGPMDLNTCMLFS